MCGREWLVDTKYPPSSAYAMLYSITNDILNVLWKKVKMEKIKLVFIQNIYKLKISFKLCNII